MTPHTDSWTLDDAAHLLSRAGFGGTPARISALHRFGLRDAVEVLLEGSRDEIPPPVWTRVASRTEAAVGPLFDDSSEARRARAAAIRAEQARRMRELREWWFGRMLYGGHPLREKMTLFWHGHFATSVQKVIEAYPMWRQNQTLRELALDNFGDLTRAMSRDPAMIKWLDLGGSNRNAPNENFARELMELFMLGEGNYTEADIKEGARAFTGYRISKKLQFQLAGRAHDTGVKHFMGHSGNFSGDDIIAILLRQPACANFLARKLWTFFGNENPSEAILNEIAGTLRAANFELKPALRQIFTSREFYAASVRRHQVKGPVQWLAQLCIALELEPPAQPTLDGVFSRLGQVLFAPPNVSGWKTGAPWIGGSTLALRYQIATLFAGEKAPRPFGVKHLAPVDVAVLFPGALRQDPAQLADAVIWQIFGTLDVPRLRNLAYAQLETGRQPIRDVEIRSLLTRLMTTPEFQLT